jgi:hypothetical protein
MKITGKQFKRVVSEYKRLQFKNRLRSILEEECGLGAPVGLEKEEEVVELPAIAEPHMAAEDEAVSVASGPPVPADYEAVTSLLGSNPEFVNLAITQVMDMAGAGCERSTVMAVIDFLKGMLGELPEEVEPPAETDLDSLLMAPMLLDPEAGG